ncbi:hypothetical protein AAXB25_14415 [Paenibacillus lautus]|uniref:hypothetical protein n=1 Tax=Paenibacillus lautus TaxID=1401 RepID=UPI003D2B30A8
MLKFCVEQWDKNKDKLKKDIEDNLKSYNEFSYTNLVEKVVDLILNDEDSDYETTFDSEEITVIDDGDYQGTILYIIPRKTYQPSECDYLMTYVGYGSCSGCDTLQSIRMWYYDEEPSAEEKNRFVKDMMRLCKDIVQNIIKPYNFGWRNDSRFDVVEA